MKNLFADIPGMLDEELVESVMRSERVRIERIVSQGHCSPKKGWYDQLENEWVTVLEGSGRLEFEDGREVTLSRGDCLDIPKRTKHRVVWTDPSRPTVWLAVFY
ncbi:MAG: cupin [Opitutales bacterium TMED158]|nr:MAG: cupin [Opitutales bacterium TMED158]